MGKGPQQIGPQLFAFDFVLQPLGLLDPGGKGTDDNGDDQHHQKGERIAADAHIKTPKGVGEHIVDAEHPDDRRHNTPGVTGRTQRDNGYGQHKDQHSKGIVIIMHLGKQDAYANGRRQKKRRK